MWFIGKLSRCKRGVGSIIGAIFLVLILLTGFTFYFLDPCIAPILVAMLPLLVYDVLPLVLFVFCLGTIIPFVGIGIFAGSVSKLARVTYRQRFLIRAISGLILIGYALYLLVFTFFLN